MPELTPQERLQPSLLDRLTDDEPDKKQESRDKRVLNMRKLRASVIRDLEWLLNTGNLAHIEDFDDCPFVAKSVVNYGIPALAGETASGLDLRVLERTMRQAIWDFEPRILRGTVKVRAAAADDRSSTRIITFEIEGELWGQPQPLHLYLKTEVDLESGQISVAGEGKLGR